MPTPSITEPTSPRYPTTQTANFISLNFRTTQAYFYRFAVISQCRHSCRRSYQAAPHPSSTSQSPLKSPQGFVAYLGRRQFASPILAGEGCSLDIMWQKGGFETLSTPFIVEKDNETPPAPNTSSARRIITPSSFHITEERNQQQASSNFTIKVNGIEIDGPKAFTFSDLKNARVEISAPGYVTFSGNYDLASTSLVLVQMHSAPQDLPLRAAAQDPGTVGTGTYLHQD